MLPSMPILFTRESQDAFGNKIVPSTSFFNQNLIPKPAIAEKPTAPEPEQGTSKEDEGKKETSPQKTEEPSKQNINTLEEALVKSYYSKVQSRLAARSSVPKKFVQFQELLQTFDPTKETPLDLYGKMEQLLGEEHKDILEEFLMFLTPGQATQVGRFMDHFNQIQILTFIELLQKTFSRKKTVLRKVLRAITTAINSGNSEQLKTRVLPSLRSNPRLSQMFKSLFPDERPPDSVYDTGTDTIDESFLTADNGYDVWEFEETADDKRNIVAKEGLDTVYLQGRVFLQHGRMLRTACVTYPYSKEPYRAHVRRLAPNHCRLSPPESDEELSSPKRTTKNACKIPPKRPRKQVKSPTKQVKDVNDNTKHKDCLPQTLNNPKTVKGKAQNAKQKSCCKDKKEDKTAEVQRSKKTQEKNVVSIKKEETPKMKATADKAKIEKDTRKEESRSWTREEDKTMLQVLKGEAGSKQVFGRISELLPHRSASEIKERFCYVMNLLQQMAVSEVT